MPHPERRQHPRISCDFRGELYILFPEETFRPVPFMVTVKDVSRAGLRAICRNLSEEQHQMLLSTVRFARIQVRGDNRTARVYCRVVWLAQRAAPDGSRYHELGMGYDLREEGAQEAIDFIYEWGTRHQVREGEETLAGESPEAE
ncbi:PilZ domain-containing protein [Candidatus Poribacteria bacterium]|nr:PilZ domain-containing protein [Candidatus Poribacteria bacterium]